MARVLHPAYFPAGRDASFFGTCSYWGGLPLLQGMEAYWRVRKWKVLLNLQWADDLSLSINEIISVSNVDFPTQFNRPVTSENQLVCENSQTWELNTSGNGAGVSVFFKDSFDFFWEADGFEFLQFEWPERRDPSVIVPIPITLRIGQYEKMILGGVANQPDTTGSGSVEAVEWWPYEDAQGRALYNTSTGQPL